MNSKKVKQTGLKRSREKEIQEIVSLYGLILLAVILLEQALRPSKSLRRDRLTATIR